MLHLNPQSLREAKYDSASSRSENTAVRPISSFVRLHQILYLISPSIGTVEHQVGKSLLTISSFLTSQFFGNPVAAGITKPQPYLGLLCERLDTPVEPFDEVQYPIHHTNVHV